MREDYSMWMLGLKDGVRTFVDSLMMEAEPYGRFRIAKEGCLFWPYDILSVHFAADIYTKLRMVDSISPTQKKQWEYLSTSWIDKSSGEICDPDGLERFFDGMEDKERQVVLLRHNLNRCCHGVFDAGKQHLILQQDVKEFLNIKTMFAALDSLSWEKESWSAGAHAAHYILAMHEWTKQGHDEFNDPINRAVDYLYSKQNEADGTFGGTGQSDISLIGGMLKIGIRLFVTLGRELRYPERMIDSAIRMLRSGNFKGNCPAHNALIVLEMCQNFTNYRCDDIESEAWKSLKRDIIPLYKADGGFCGDPATSEYWVWNLKMVDAGYDQSNLHSTNVMLNAVRVVAEIVGLENELGFEASGYRKSELGAK